MLKSKKIACVIPARLNSSRFPRKVLAPLKGKPLVQWVFEAARAIPFFDAVVVACDSAEVAACVAGFGGVSQMTSEQCASGTDRLIELMQKKRLDADIWVNWQADEPFVTQAMIEDLLQSCHEPVGDVWTLKKRFVRAEEIQSPHHVKVVTDERDFALYFSRLAIPYDRDGIGAEHFKHIGLYAYRKEALAKIAVLSPCPLEKAEQLEQLRFLYHGLKVRVHNTSTETLGIDLPEHLVQAEQLL